ncbi:hypothetical protein TNCV_1084011 [Trichonephila clavipes]|nr:hypothetical protein TNCV_1084011 [Trichonephila clavipes]
MLDHLEDNIRRVIADIRPQMLEKVIENWTYRLDYIRASPIFPPVSNLLTKVPESSSVKVSSQKTAEALNPNFPTLIQKIHLVSLYSDSLVDGMKSIANDTSEWNVPGVLWGIPSIYSIILDPPSWEMNL